MARKALVLLAFFFGFGSLLVAQTAPQVTISPQYLLFGVVEFEHTSDPQTVTVTNSGTATLNISSIATTSSFQILFTTCGSALAAGASCQLQVAFSPTINALAGFGSLVVNDDAGGSPQSVYLEGSITTDRFRFDGSLNFGVRPLGIPTPPYTLTIAVLGVHTLTVNKVSSISPDFSVSSGCKGFMVAGQSCNFTVVWTPSALGPLSSSGVVDVTIDAMDSVDPLTGQPIIINGTHLLLSALGFGALRPVRQFHDFDGDGKADLVWGGGLHRLWHMDGTASTLVLPQLTDPFFPGDGSAAVVEAVADFDGDGKGDFLWRTGVGHNVIWLMNGGQHFASGSLPDVLDPNWLVVATADFDGDGKADILWRHAKNGSTAFWNISGTTLLGGQFLTTVTDLNWNIVGAGDFDGDGKADILWRNAKTGENAIWFMNGSTIKSAAFITRISDMNWQVAGIGDFDGDLKADILWRNRSTGANALWLMNGSAIANASFITTVKETAWEVAGTGDFNGDGKADIIWRNPTRRQNAIWLMNGAGMLDAQFLPNPDLDSDVH